MAVANTGPETVNKRLAMESQQTVAANDDAADDGGKVPVDSAQIVVDDGSRNRQIALEVALRILGRCFHMHIS